MPDISMCLGENCPKRNECYLFRAIPSEFRQAYLAYTPYDHERRQCDYFIKIESTKPIRVIL